MSPSTMPWFSNFQALHGVNGPLHLAGNARLDFSLVTTAPPETISPLKRAFRRMSPLATFIFPSTSTNGFEPADPILR
jgi:thiamine monophosphate kinase